MNTFWEVYFSCQRHDRGFSISSMLNTLLAVPKRKGKVYSPSTIQTQAMASRILGCPPYNRLSGGVCFIIKFSFWLQDWASQLSPLSCNDKWINTNHENNPLSMEDTDHPLPLHERYRHTKQMLIWMIRGGTCKFTWNDRVIPHIGRYSGLI
jgi:hypothetical protein